VKKYNPPEDSEYKFFARTPACRFFVYNITNAVILTKDYLGLQRKEFSMFCSSEVAS